MDYKTCMVTGHRDIPGEKIEYVKQALHREVELAVQDGFTYFISGFAEAVDLYFASIVAEIKKDNPYIYLEAAIPHHGRFKTKDKPFHELLGQCDAIGCHSEEYNAGVFMKRNRFMVNQSERVIAVFDGRKRGGTYATMQVRLHNEARNTGY